MNNSTAAHKDIAPDFTYPQPKDEITIGDIGDKSLSLNFDGGDISSDGGALLIRVVEAQIGQIKSMAGVIPDSRDARYVRHTLTDLLMQRVAQIACGYEDADDCDDLRDDPVFKILAGRYPEIGDALSSQPTMSRFECSISRTTLYRLAIVFVDASVASYAAPPPVIVLDFDDTEDRVHGNQQLNLFNGYYGCHCFMPLHVYEGLSGKLITTILKPGKRSDGKQMLSIVKRLVDLLHAEWPETQIIFRGDSHFAFPMVMNYIEATENVMYVTGMAGDSRLK